MRSRFKHSPMLIPFHLTTYSEPENLQLKKQ